jgi:hypothetical protein
LNAQASLNASKDMRAPSSGSISDGGFGVGRFVILFCAPLWLFTTRHLLVLGHYNIYKIICRRCFAPVFQGSGCTTCGLLEADTPVGTTFLVNYHHLNLDHFFDQLAIDYLRYTDVDFPIHVKHKELQPLQTYKMIEKNEWFTVNKSQGQASTALYFIRTASGMKYQDLNIFFDLK